MVSAAIIEEQRLRLVRTVSTFLLSEPKLQCSRITKYVRDALPPRKNENASPWQYIYECSSWLSAYHPEWLLKLALFIRADLGIRTCANLLLAICASTDECHIFLKKYYSATVRLPTDWLEVADYAVSLPHMRGRGLPRSLRNVMVSKFADFDAYQLGKYMNRKCGQFSIKKLISLLHIGTPRETICQILGLRYPQTEEEFASSGLPGTFDPSRAGKRMRIPIPETWETQLSAEGNTREVWEKLIDSGKVPYVATLRNLRNIIMANVSSGHHEKVLEKLTCEGAVVNSRQFPYRFYTAFDAVESAVHHPNYVQRRSRLRRFVATKEKYKSALNDALKWSIINNLDPVAGKTVIVFTLDEPERQQKSSQSVIHYAEISSLLALMFHFACEDCSLHWYRSSDDNDARTYGARISPDSITTDILSCVKTLAASGDFPPPYSGFEAPLLPALAAGAHASYAVQTLDELLRSRERVDNIVWIGLDMLHSDTDVVQRAVDDFLVKYRMLCNPDLLFVNVGLTARKGTTFRPFSPHEMNIFVPGFSDQVLQFVSARGSDQQMRYIDRIDVLKGLLHRTPRVAEPSEAPKGKHAAAPGVRPADRRPPRVPHRRDTRTSAAEQVSSTLRVPVVDVAAATPDSNWRFVSVFLSSTFVDMHAERDVLSRTVFPSLRSRLAQYQTDLAEVDLRWGLAPVEEQSVGQSASWDSDNRVDETFVRSVQFCLEQIDRCRPFFVAFLGARYGSLCSKRVLEALAAKDPKFAWIGTLAAECPVSEGISVTELEVRYALMEGCHQWTCGHVYIRDDDVYNSIGDREARAAFTTQSSYQSQRLAQLKEDVVRHSQKPSNNSAALAVHRYTCAWNPKTGRITALHDLARMVERNLFSGLCRELGVATFDEGMWKPVAESPQERPSPVRQWARNDRHMSYAEHILQFFCGQTTALSAIRTFANSTSAAETTEIGIVEAPSGCGKTAVVCSSACSLMKQYDRQSTSAWRESRSCPRKYVFLHVCTMESGGSTAFWIRFREFLLVVLEEERQLSDETVSESGAFECAGGSNLDDLAGLCMQLLAEIHTRAASVLVLIDGVDFASDARRVRPSPHGYTGTAAHSHLASWFRWLTIHTVPQSCRLLFTMRSESGAREVLDAVLSADPMSSVAANGVATLAPLTVYERRRLVQYELHRFSKQLSVRQEDQLLRKRDAATPLYLLLASMELRLFGQYDEVDAYIRSFAPTTTGLLEQLVVRLEADIDAPFVRLMLSSLLCASEGGLAEADAFVMWVLSGHHSVADGESGTSSMAIRANPSWDDVQRVLADTLRCFTAQHSQLASAAERFRRLWRLMVQSLFHLLHCDADGRFRLTHRSLLDVVAKRYLRSAADETLTRLRLGLVHINTLCSGLHDATDDCTRRRHYELALTRVVPTLRDANAVSLCVSLLTDPQYIENKLAAKQGLLLLHEYETVLNGTTGKRVSPLLRQRVAEWSSFVNVRFGVLVDDPTAVWTHAMNRERQPETLGVITALREKMAMAISPSAPSPSLSASDVWARVSFSPVGVGGSAISQSITTPSGRSILSAQHWVSPTTLHFWVAACAADWKVYVYRSAQPMSRQRPCPVSSLCLGLVFVLSGSEGPVRACHFTTLGRAAPIFSRLPGSSLSDSFAVPEVPVLITGGDDRLVRVWSLESGRHVAALRGHRKPVRCIAVHPKAAGVIVTGADDNCVRVWNLRLGCGVVGVREHTAPVSSVDWHSDGWSIVSGSWDRQVRVTPIDRFVWNTVMAEQQTSARDATAELKRLQSEGYELLQTSQSVSLALDEEHSEHTGSVSAVRFVRNTLQRLVATGYSSGLVVVWDVEARAPLTVLRGHIDTVAGVDVDPLGRFVVTASRDGSVKAWPVSAAATTWMFHGLVHGDAGANAIHCVQELCSRAKDNDPSGTGRVAVLSCGSDGRLVLSDLQLRASEVTAVECDAAQWHGHAAAIDAMDGAVVADGPQQSPHSQRAVYVTIARDRRVLAWTANGDVERIGSWMRSQTQCTASIMRGSLPLCVSVHPTGDSAVVGFADGSVVRWSLPELMQSRGTYAGGTEMVVRPSTRSPWRKENGDETQTYATLARHVSHGKYCAVAFHSGHLLLVETTAPFRRWWTTTAYSDWIVGVEVLDADEQPVLCVVCMDGSIFATRLNLPEGALVDYHLVDLVTLSTRFELEFRVRAATIAASSGILFLEREDRRRFAAAINSKPDGTFEVTATAVSEDSRHDGVALAAGIHLDASDVVVASRAGYIGRTDLFTMSPHIQWVAVVAGEQPTAMCAVQASKPLVAVGMASGGIVLYELRSLRSAVDSSSGNGSQRSTAVARTESLRGLSAAVDADPQQYTAAVVEAERQWYDGILGAMSFRKDGDSANQDAEDGAEPAPSEEVPQGASASAASLHAAVMFMRARGMI